MKQDRAGLSLRKKIIIVGLLMITLPTLMVWQVSSFFFRYEEEKTTREMMFNTLRQNMLNINSQINIAIATCNNIAFDPTLVRYLRFANNRYLNDAEILDVLFYLNRFIDNYEALNPSARIILYLDFPELLPRNRNRYVSLNELSGEINALMFQRDVTTLVLPPQEYPSGRLDITQREYYTVLQSVSGIRPSQGMLAVVAARIENSVLHHVINDISLEPGDYVFLHDDNRIFYARQGEKEIPVPSELNLNDLLTLDHIKTNGKYYNIYSTQSENTGWKLTALISQDSFMAMTRRTVLITLLIALFFAALTSVITIRYFNRIARWLEELSKAMEQATGGNYNVLIPPGGDREIKTIQTSYNTMVKTIQEHIEDHYQQQLRIQSAEFRVLENQIKPHFLYNTLDILKFRALKAGTAELASNLDDMARYFRMVLSEGRRFLPLIDELEQCRLYVKLWNFRNECNIILEAKIPEDVEFCGLARFLLQPLIENAIIHGIRPKSGRSGIIHLAAIRENENLFIQIIDDGQGISEELRRSLPGDGGRGFGIFNVHTRIRFLYGPSYGLSFPWSEPGDNCVLIRLPYRPIINQTDEDIDPAEAG